MIKGSDLQNRQEFGDPPPRPRGKMAEFAERLAAARVLPPPDNACRACFRAGRDAAAAMLEGAGRLEDRIGAARGVQPKHHHSGDRSFQAGRDAVIAAVAGA